MSPRKRRPMTLTEMQRRAARARLKKISPERRQEIARKAARARWGPPKS